MNDDIERAIESLTTRLGTNVDLPGALSAVVSLAARSPSDAAELVERDACRLAVSAILRSRVNAGGGGARPLQRWKVQGTACIALAALARGARPEQEVPLRIVREGGAPAVAEVMGDHPRNRKLQRNGCAALGGIAGGIEHGTVRDALRDADAHGLIAAAMAQHSGDTGVVAAALHAAAQMCGGGGAHARSAALELVEAGFAKEVHAALAEHSGAARVQSVGCAILAAIADAQPDDELGAPTTMSLAAARDAAAAVGAAVRAHATSRAVLRDAGRAAASLARSANGALALVEMGAADAIVAILTATALDLGDTAVLVNGCRALAAVAERAPAPWRPDAPLCALTVRALEMARADDAVPLLGYTLRLLTCVSEWCGSAPAREQRHVAVAIDELVARGGAVRVVAAVLTRCATAPSAGAAPLSATALRKLRRDACRALASLLDVGGAAASAQLRESDAAPAALATILAHSKRDCAVQIAACRCVATVVSISPAAARTLARGGTAPVGLVHAMAIHSDSRVLQAYACSALGAILGGALETVDDASAAACVVAALLDAKAPSAVVQALSRAHTDDAAPAAQLQQMAASVCRIVGALCHLEAIATRDASGGRGEGTAVQHAFDRAGAVSVIVERLCDASLPLPPRVVGVALRAVATLADGCTSAARSVVHAGLRNAVTSAFALASGLRSDDAALVIEAAACRLVASTLVACQSPSGATPAPRAMLTASARLDCVKAVAQAMARTPSSDALSSDDLRRQARRMHTAASAALTALVEADDRDERIEAATSEIRTLLFSNQVPTLACSFANENALRMRSARADKGGAEGRETRRLLIAACALLCALWSGADRPLSAAAVAIVANAVRSEHASVRASGCRSAFVLATGSPNAAAAFAKERSFAVILIGTMRAIATLDNEVSTVAARLDAVRALDIIVTSFVASTRAPRRPGSTSSKKAPPPRTRKKAATAAALVVKLPAQWVKAGLTRAAVQVTSSRMLEGLVDGSRASRDQHRVLGCGSRLIATLAGCSLEYAALLVRDGGVAAVVNSMNSCRGAALGAAILVDGSNALASMLAALGKSDKEESQIGTTEQSRRGPSRSQLIQMALSAVTNAMVSGSARRLLQRTGCQAVCAICEDGGAATSAALSAMAQSKAALKLCETIVAATRNFGSSRSTAQDACKALRAIARIGADGKRPPTAAWTAGTSPSPPTPPIIIAALIEADAVVALTDVLSRCGARMEWRQVGQNAVRALGAIAQGGGSEVLLLSGAIEAIVLAVGYVCGEDEDEDESASASASAARPRSKSKQGRLAVGKGSGNVPALLRASACETIYSVAQTSRVSAQRAEMEGAVHAVAEAMLRDSGADSRCWRVHGWGCKALTTFARASALAFDGSSDVRPGGLRTSRAAAALVGSIRLCCNKYSRRLTQDACTAALGLVRHPDGMLSQQLLDAGAAEALVDLIRVLDGLGVHPKSGAAVDQGEVNNARAARALLARLRRAATETS